MTAANVPDVMDRLLDFGILPFADELVRIQEAGEVPVVAFEPKGVAIQALAVLGRKGNAECFGVSRTRMLKVIGRGDEVMARWLRAKPRSGHVKVFVAMHYGSLLVNFAPGVGWYLEPGSTDVERGAA